MIIHAIEIRVKCPTPQVVVGPRVCVQVNSAPGGYYEDWLNSLQVADSDNAQSLTGNSAEEKGVAIGKYYLTAFNHVEVAGGIPKKRLV